VRGHGTVDQVRAGGRGDRPEIEVPQVSLAQIFEAHAPVDGVDFLKVDVEGWEAEVLASAEWTRHRPRVVVVEAVDQDGQSTYGRWEPGLLAAGYQFALFDGVNRFYCCDEEAAQLFERLAAPANVLDNWRSAREVSLQKQLLSELDAAEARRSKASVAHQAERIAHEAERIAHEAERIAHEAERIAHEETRRELASVYDSTSWRLTAPVRDASRLRRMLQHGGNA
jgi:hypothetical protein